MESEVTGAAAAIDWSLWGTALAVVLLVAIIPLMILNVRRFREQEERR